MTCSRSRNLGLTNECTCTFTQCENWGKCCSCVMFRRTKSGIPGCFFTPEAEKTGIRDVDFFIKNVGVPLKERHD